MIRNYIRYVCTDVFVVLRLFTLNFNYVEFKEYVHLTGVQSARYPYYLNKH